MKIIIERIATSSLDGTYLSGHIRLYALAEEAETCKIRSKDGHIPRLILLDYTPSSHQTLFNIHTEDYKKFYEVAATENRLIFNSELSLNDYVIKLAKSQYKNNETYDALENNCVHAALYGLKKAGINIEPEKKYGLKHLICCFWCPSTIITPRELIKLLKQHQVEVGNTTEEYMQDFGLFMDEDQPFSTKKSV